MLTKSKFLGFLDCPNEFWLDVNFPEPESERSVADKHRREEGYDVQRQAAKLAVFQPRDGVAVATPKKFETEDLVAISDFVITDLTTGEIDIYEAKATTSPNEKKHLQDVAFQAHVAGRAGFQVRNIFLVTCSREYVRDRDIDPELLIEVTDLTEKVAAIRDEISSQVEAALTCHLDEPPPSLVDHCSEKLDCRFIRRHFREIPDYNVSHIFNQGKKLPELLKLGIVDIRHVPADFVATERQQKQIDVEISQQSHIDVRAIRDKLREAQFPLHFLDYEAFGYAVPHYDGMRPYEPAACRRVPVPTAKTAKINKNHCNAKGV